MHSWQTTTWRDLTNIDWCDMTWQKKSKFEEKFLILAHLRFLSSTDVLFLFSRCVVSLLLLLFVVVMYGVRIVWCVVVHSVALVSMGVFPCARLCVLDSLLQGFFDEMLSEKFLEVWFFFGRVRVLVACVWVLWMIRISLVFRVWDLYDSGSAIGETFLFSYKTC